MDSSSANKSGHVTHESGVDREGVKKDVFYFQPHKDEMQHLIWLTSLEKNLFLCLAHTFRLGIYLDQKIKGAAVKMDPTASGASFCMKYVEAALKTDFAADRLFPIRLSGPSMKSILHTIPLRSALATSSKGIFQLCIWRTFAFGHKDRIQLLDMRQQTSLDLILIANTITAWGSKQNIALPAYGNFQVIKTKVPTMVQLLWEFSEQISADFTARKSPFAFTDLYERLSRKGVPSIPRGGIVTWLLISDFFEYGLCLPPTENDLAAHMIPPKGSRGSPSGPSKAVTYVAEQSHEHVPQDADALAEVFRSIFKVFNNPPEQMPTIKKLARDCEDVQGRKLSIVDVEHALCKIARQVKM